MSARRGPIFNQDDPTIMAGAVSARPQVAAAAVVRKSAVLIRTVPAVYDAADDGELVGATELFDCGGTSAAPQNRNFGGTALMPAAFGAAARDAVMASMKQLEVQRPMASASGTRPVQPAPPPPAAPPSLGLTKFELMFGVSAAVVVGLGAALLFVYLG